MSGYPAGLAPGPAARIHDQEQQVQRRVVIRWVALAVVSLAVIGASFYERYRVDEEFARQVRLARQEAERIQSTVVLFTEQALPAGLPLANVLEEDGIAPSTAVGLVQAVQPVFDLRRLRAGNEIAIGRSVLGELRAIRYQIDADRMLNVTPTEAGQFHAEVQTIPSTLETSGVGGRINDSLFGAVMDAGEKPELAVRLADIFGFDLDFYTDPRPGDTFRVLVEKKVYTNGRTASYGRILAAEYNNNGRVFRAILFHDTGGKPEYFSGDGKALKRAFLHSPLKFAAPITSHFSYHRLHPILRTYRPHLGIDYGAPVGTPVQAIGAGRVVSAGPKGGAGNLVELAHSNGYHTYYMHLSRILVRGGQRVEMGERIGLVGATGLATGPHLDFRISQNGVFRNFLALHLPSADPVARHDWSEFTAMRDLRLAQLPDLDAILARAQPSVPARTAGIGR